MSHATVAPRLITIALGQYDVVILPPDPCRAACQVIIPGVLALQKESTNPVHRAGRRRSAGGAES
ncbi:MAG TPA: hypothetical protein VGF87_05685 [Acidimicrobiales bacterium]|jgi:hypothetical protein